MSAPARILVVEDEGIVGLYIQEARSDGLRRSQRRLDGGRCDQRRRTSAARSRAHGHPAAAGLLMQPSNTYQLLKTTRRILDR